MLRERKGGERDRESKREKHWCYNETLIDCLLYAPLTRNQTCNLQCTDDVQPSEPLQLGKKYFWSFGCQVIFSLDFNLGYVSTVNYKWCFNWWAFLFGIVDAITSQDNSSWFPPQIASKCFHFCLTNICSSIKSILFCLRLFELGFWSLYNGKNPSKGLTGIFGRIILNMQ